MLELPRYQDIDTEGLRGVAETDAIENHMKLRRIGNSVGTTFSREVLAAAHIDPSEELEIVAVAGEIRIKKANPSVLLDLSKEEVALLASVDAGGREWRSIVKKALAAMSEDKE